MSAAGVSAVARISASVCLAFLLGVAAARAEVVRIVSWNAKPTLYEGLEDRLTELRKLADELKPDVLVLVEVTGEIEAKMIAGALGWPEYHGIVTNWARLSTQPSFAIEAAVISKVPIIGAIEFDPKVDGHHEVFSHKGTVPGLVSEKELSSRGISGFGDPLARTDRGTIRVDLDNGLTIFPVHLKSDYSPLCQDLGKAIETFEKSGLAVPPAAREFYEKGFAAATKERVSNATKRERVLAAVVREGSAAAEQRRIVVIAGDMNTTFEAGKFGTKVADCTLSDFSCAPAPFPASACQGGDGYDDTLGILEEGLVGSTKWRVLSRGLGRTYDDTAFGDFAIDHIAVPIASAAKFSAAQKAATAYGSDHFPIWTDFTR